MVQWSNRRFPFYREIGILARLIGRVWTVDVGIMRRMSLQTFQENKCDRHMAN